MKKIFLIIALITFISSYSQEQKIVYRTNGNDVVGWVHRLVDTTNYQLKVNEYFGDLFQKPILDNGVIVESWIEQDEIEALKLSKIIELKAIANSKFRETQWYYDREVRLKKGNRPPKNVPQNIIDRDMAIYSKVDSLEIVINGLTTYKQIRDFKIEL